MSSSTKPPTMVDMSTKIGGRIVQPALPVVGTNPPTGEELTFTASLQKYCDENIPLESREGIQRRERALNKIGQLSREWIRSVCRKKGFTPEVVESAGGQLFTSGSYRLGVHEPGADIDTILVAPNMCTREDFFGGLMENDTRDPSSLSERIRRHPDVTNFVPVEGAAVPLLTFDWEGVNIDLLFARLNSAAVPVSLDIDNDAVLDGVDSATEKSLNGPRVTNLIAALVSGTPQRYQTFLTVVRCVRKIFKARGLYMNKMGYWGGVNINIGVALCVQLYPLDPPASLLRKFFLVFKTWRWPNPVMLTKPHDAGLGLPVWSSQHAHRQVAPIITPAYPAMNSTLAVSRQTLKIMHEEFCRGHELVDQLWKQHQQNPAAELDWKELFRPSDFFINYPNYLSLCIVGPTQADTQAWAGFVESRLRKLSSDMLGRSLPLSRIQLWPKKIEACVAEKGALLTKAQRENSITYFIGFQVDMLRMRGGQLNLELQLNNFREWELTKYTQIVQGMDLVARSFKVKEMPRICFESMGMTKEEAMKRRRELRNADPRRQEKKRLKRLNELRAELQRKKEEQENKRKRKLEEEEEEEEKEEAAAAVAKEEDKEEHADAKGAETEPAVKRKRTDVVVVKTEMDGGTDSNEAGANGTGTVGTESDEANLLENALDTLQTGSATREEAEEARNKLLAETAVEGDGEAGPIEDDDEAIGYTGDGARQMFLLPRKQDLDGRDNQQLLQQETGEVGVAGQDPGQQPQLQQQEKTHFGNKYVLPVGKEQAAILRKAGCPIVSDDEHQTIGGNMVPPWRKRNPNIPRVAKKLPVQLRTKFDVVELDANGLIIDKGDDNFSPSPKWTGRKAGFEFKVGERGLGYYRTGKKVVVPSNTAY